MGIAADDFKGAIPEIIRAAFDDISMRSNRRMPLIKEAEGRNGESRCASMGAVRCGSVYVEIQRKMDWEAFMHKAESNLRGPRRPRRRRM
jgi:hypothetical protein